MKTPRSVSTDRLAQDYRDARGRLEYRQGELVARLLTLRWELAIVERAIALKQGGRQP